MRLLFVFKHFHMKRYYVPIFFSHPPVGSTTPLQWAHFFLCFLHIFIFPLCSDLHLFFFPGFGLSRVSLHTNQWLLKIWPLKMFLLELCKVHIKCGKCNISLSGVWSCNCNDYARFVISFLKDARAIASLASFFSSLLPVLPSPRSVRVASCF